VWRASACVFLVRLRLCDRVHKVLSWHPMTRVRAAAAAIASLALLGCRASVSATPGKDATADSTGSLTSDANGGQASADADQEGGFSVDAADAGKDALAAACASPYECINFSGGPLVSCCIRSACIYGQNAIDAFPCTDADVQLIQASNYDRSCAVDTDCIAVGEGNFCVVGAGDCPTAAISKSAYARYKADVAKTNAAFCRAISSCGSGVPGPCCRNGSCQVGAQCPGIGPSDAGSDAGDTGSD
jgi:hypothetical protein